MSGGAVECPRCWWRGVATATVYSPSPAPVDLDNKCNFIRLTPLQNAMGVIVDRFTTRRTQLLNAALPPITILLTRSGVIINARRTLLVRTTVAATRLMTGAPRPAG